MWRTRNGKGFRCKNRNVNVGERIVVHRLFEVDGIEYLDLVSCALHQPAALDQDASDWLPSNQGFQCQYVARQISVKYKYHLWVTPREKATMKNILSTCPEEKTVGLEDLINQAQ